MKKLRSRKGDYEHEKWLRMQRILGILVFVLSVLLCTIEMDFAPAILAFLFMTSTFMPEKKRGDKETYWYACGVNEPEIPFDSRLAAWKFVDTHPGYTDVIPVDLSDL